MVWVDLGVLGVLADFGGLSGLVDMGSLVGLRGLGGLLNLIRIDYIFGKVVHLLLVHCFFSKFFIKTISFYILGERNDQIEICTEEYKFLCHSVSSVVES